MIIISQIVIALVLSLFSTLSYTQEIITLRDKIGQMLIMGFDGKSIKSNSAITKQIQHNNIGGVILFDYNQQSKTFNKNIESPDQVKQLNHQLQSAALQGNKINNRPKLPLLITVDYEGGMVNRLSPNYGFPYIPSPKKIGQGALSEAVNYAQLMAETLNQAGFNMNYFPVSDTEVNPNNPIIAKKERSFSNEPEKITPLTIVYTNQFLDHHIQCSYKHFPGHGSSLLDSHLGFVDITDTWTKEELIPFKEALAQQKHCGVVMVGHLVNRQLDKEGLPATLSYSIITELLRQNLRFDGVVMTDDMQMKAIADHYGLDTALTLSINAGVDMLIFGNNLAEQYQDSKEILDIIENKVKSGEISHSRIDEAYQHIVKMKSSI